MPTEAKTKTYLLLIDSVMTTLQNSTGAAPIAGNGTATVSLDPDSSPPLVPNAWFITFIGQPNSQKQFFETQNYRVTASEVANFVNSRNGTSFNQNNILDVRRGNDSSFFEVETG